MWSDFAFCAAFVVSWFFFSVGNRKTKDSLVCLLCLSSTIFYYSSGFYNSHSPIAHHVIYAIPFIVGVFFVSIRVKIALLCYFAIQFVAALGWIFYKFESLFELGDFIYDSFIHLQRSCLLLMLLAIITNKGNYGKADSRFTLFGHTWRDDIRHVPAYQRRDQKG